MDLLCFCSVLCLLCLCARLIFYVFILSCVCYVFVRVCLYVLCGHLLGKGWPLGSRLWCLLWVCHFPIGILGQVWYLIISMPYLCTLLTYIRKGTVSQYIQMTRCITKTLCTYAYTQPSLILMFPSFNIVTDTMSMCIIFVLFGEVHDYVWGTLSLSMIFIVLGVIHK